MRTSERVSVAMTTARNKTQAGWNRPRMCVPAPRSNPGSKRENPGARSRKSSISTQTARRASAAETQNGVLACNPLQAVEQIANWRPLLNRLLPKLGYLVTQLQESSLTATVLLEVATGLEECYI